MRCAASGSSGIVATCGRGKSPPWEGAMRLATAFACAVMLICCGVTPGHAEKRVALVVGNDRYANLPSDQQLRKAVNDARAVGDALERLPEHLRFDVIRGDNLGRQA